jgi:hypothetical protein
LRKKQCQKNQGTDETNTDLAHADERFMARFFKNFMIRARGAIFKVYIIGKALTKSLLAQEKDLIMNEEPGLLTEELGQLTEGLEKGENNKLERNFH